MSHDGVYDQINTLHAQIREDLEVLQGTPHEIRELIHLCLTQRRNEGAVRYVEAELQKLERAAVQAMRHVTELLDQTTGGDRDVVTALLEEMREMRAWERAQRLLDAGVDVMALVRRAAPDPIMLRALRMEVTTYLMCAGEAERIPTVLHTIVDLEQPLLAPFQQRVRRYELEMHLGWPRLVEALHLARALVAGNETITEIPSWNETTLSILRPTD